ncbi:MAG: amidase [Thermodesulfobacteriota bacterium]
MDDVLLLDATAQAELVHRREVAPLELVDAAIARIERLDPTLNAVILPSFDKARAQAASRDLPDGPFRGVPFLLKDLGGQSAGDRYCAGTRLLRDLGRREEADSYFTAKLRAAGFCFVGRSNTPELGLLPTTEPEAFGATRNPWSPEHSPGGSSGGSAAAVAAGMVAIAHASDGGGSIRIPASHCGLVGLKPTRGRSSFGPEAGERWSGLSCEHVVARSVRDVAAALDVVAGPMPGDPYFAPPPSGPFVGALGRRDRLRIGLMTEGPRGTAVHPECVAAATGAARLLEQLGHVVEPSYPAALHDPAGVEGLVVLIGVNTVRTLDVYATLAGRPLGPEDVEPLTWALAEAMRERRAADFLAALQGVQAFSRRLASWWSEGFDVLVTPTSAEPPPRLGWISSTREEPFRAFARAAPFSVYTSPFNLSGQPAISLPLHATADGLPVGAQLVAAYGREDVLLELAAALEEAAPWAGRRPRLP